MKKLFVFLFLSYPCFCFGVTLEDVPIGAHNRPRWKVGEYDWVSCYKATLDSAVACGLKYFKPGFMGGADTFLADSVTKITSERSLNQVCITWPHYADTAQEDSIRWWNRWYRMAERYDGDGEDDLSGLGNPVKYWELCNQPWIMTPVPWREDNDYKQGHQVFWSIDTLDSCDAVVVNIIDSVWVDTIWVYNADTVWVYNIDQVDEYPRSDLALSLQDIFWMRMNYFLKYFRISARAIREAYPAGSEVYIIGPGDPLLKGGEIIPWEVYIKDVNNNYAMLRFCPLAVCNVEAPSFPDKKYYFWKIFSDNIGEYIDIVSMHNGTQGLEEAIRGNFDLLLTTISKVKELFPNRPFWESEAFINPDADSSGIWFSNFYRGWLDNAFAGNIINLDDKIIFRSLTDHKLGRRDTLGNLIWEYWGILDSNLAHKESGVYDTLRRIIHEYFPSPEMEATAHNNQRKLQIDSQGHLHRVWSDLEINGVSLPLVRYEKSIDDGTTWKEWYIVGEGEYPALAIDADDNPAICWIAQDGNESVLHYCYYRGPGIPPVFGELMKKSYDQYMTGNFVAPSIIIDDDQVYITLETMEEKLLVPYVEYNYTIWYHPPFPVQSPPSMSTDWEVVDTWSSSTPKSLNSPSIDINGSKIPHIVYDFPGVYPPISNIYYKHRGSGNWDMQRMCVDEGSNPFLDIYGSVEYGTTAKIVYERDNDIWLASSPVLTPENISGTGASNPSRSPQILEGVVVVWSEQQSGGEYDICYKHREPNWVGGYRWSYCNYLINTGKDSKYPQITLEPTGSGCYYLNCVWTEGDEAPYEIKSKRKFFSTIGVNHNDADFMMSSDTTLSGIHWGVDTFTIDSGVTVNVTPYNGSDTTTGMLTIYANVMNILGTLSADEAGYSGAEGPGTPAEDGTLNRGGGGAGYGGEGGDGNYFSEVRPGGPAYSFGDSVGWCFGSGGANSVNMCGTVKAQGGRGGGKIMLVSEGTIKIDGRIEASGGDGETYMSGRASGGGSGGTILINCGSLAGSGSVGCCGGNGGNTSSATKGGGGAGGRVYITYTDSCSAGEIDVSGGIGPDKAQDGQPGSILAEDSLENVAILVSPVETQIGSHKRESFIKGVEFADKYVHLSAGDSILGNVDIKTSDYITIDATAVISADEKGYNSSEGVGQGIDGALLIGAGGAGYGGNGNSGDGVGEGADGGSVYGEADECSPYSLGSGGGNGVTSMGEIKGYGGYGGGRIKLESGIITINGIISASGGSGTHSSGHSAGGASGGSIWLIADTLFGSGIIKAEGGDGAITSGSQGGGGGGGRIALAKDVDYFTDTGVISVAGGIGPPDTPADSGTICQTTGEGGTQSTDGEIMPMVFKFSQNYPNPFVKKTVIKYQLPMKSKVSLRIYDVAGRCVKTLIDGEKSIGYYEVKWDGEGLSTGIYFAKFKAGDYKETKKLILIR